MSNQFPELSKEFFDVCQSAIKAAAWKYDQFDRVQVVEGELERLRAFYFSLPASTTPEIQTLVAQNEELESIGIDDTTSVSSAPNEAIQPCKDPVEIAPVGVLSPDDAKKAPTRPMPDDIRQIVEAGVEVAKNPPAVREVKVEELSADPDAARNAWNKPF